MRGCEELGGAVVVKLGGSLITDKSKPFSYRPRVVSSLAKEMLASGERIVLVHGGGSFGHPAAKKYGLSTHSSRSTASGVNETRQAMYKLDQLVCETLSSSGMKPYPFSPFSLLQKTERRFGPRWLNALLDSALTPITFGDVVADDLGFKILSGDVIAYEISKMLRAKRCVFALDVDGLFRRADKRQLIRQISYKELKRLNFEQYADATGGIRLKVSQAVKAASDGTEVCIVSGLRTREFAKSLKGLSFYGTSVEVT